MTDNCPILQPLETNSDLSTSSIAPCLELIVIHMSVHLFQVTHLTSQSPCPCCVKLAFEMISRRWLPDHRSQVKTGHN